MSFLYFFFGLLFGIILSKLLIQKQNKKGSEKVINAAEYQDPFYVEVKTGKYFFMSDLLKIYSRHDLFKLLAD